MLLHVIAETVGPAELHSTTLVEALQHRSSMLIPLMSDQRLSVLEVPITAHLQTLEVTLQKLLSLFRPCWIVESLDMFGQVSLAT